MEEIKSIRISELKDFKNHPFHVQQDMELCALCPCQYRRGGAVAKLPVTEAVLSGQDFKKQGMGNGRNLCR